jgi:hypothetical protein
MWVWEINRLQGKRGKQNDKEFVNYERMCELYVVALVTRWSTHCYACNQVVFFSQESSKYFTFNVM